MGIEYDFAKLKSVIGDIHLKIYDPSMLPIQDNEDLQSRINEIMNWIENSKKKINELSESNIDINRQMLEVQKMNWNMQDRYRLTKSKKWIELLLKTIVEYNDLAESYGELEKKYILYKSEYSKLLKSNNLVDYHSSIELENQNLRNKLDLCKDHHGELITSEDFSKLVTEKDNLELENSELKESILNMKNVISLKNETIKNLKGDTEEIKEILDIKNKLIDFDNKYKELEKELEKSRKTTATWQSKYTKLNNEYKDLKNKEYDGYG